MGFNSSRLGLWCYHALPSLLGLRVSLHMQHYKTTKRRHTNLAQYLHKLHSQANLVCRHIKESKNTTTRSVILDSQHGKKPSRSNNTCVFWEALMKRGFSLKCVSCIDPWGLLPIMWIKYYRSGGSSFWLIDMHAEYIFCFHMLLNGCVKVIF